LTSQPLELPAVAVPVEVQSVPPLPVELPTVDVPDLVEVPVP
jgi:hypothetical protein